MNPDLMDEPDETWDDLKNQTKSTYCQCTLEEKRKSRGLFASGRKAYKSPSGLSHHLGETILGTGNSLEEENPSAKWGWLKKRFLLPVRSSADNTVSLNSGDVSDESSGHGGSLHSSHVSLHTLPPEILYPILDMVYEDETRSRDLCRCSRPKTSYDEIRKVSLEHHVANTALLRVVCRAFHGWALESVFRGRDIEVDLSDIGQLQQRFKTNGVEAVKRLGYDFPKLGQDGVVMYLGNPGQVSNIRSVVEVMRTSQADLFSGVTLWDLDFHHRKPVLGMPRVEFSRIPQVDIASAPDLAEALVDIMSDITRGVYDEERLLFAELLVSLARNSRSLSTMHIPVGSIQDAGLSAIGNKEYRNVRSLTRGCKSVVFREFIHYNKGDVEELREYIEESLLQLRSREDFPVNIAFELNFDTLARSLRTRVLRGVPKQWGVQTQEPLDASHIEFRKVGHQIPLAGMLEIIPLGPLITRIGGPFTCLESLVIQEGRNMTLTSGTLLYILLPLRQNLNTLIYKRTGIDGSLYEPVIATRDMDPHHGCVLLRQYPRLKKLDLPSRFCHELFEKDKVGFVEVPSERDWNLRHRSGWGRCSYDGRGDPAPLSSKIWTPRHIEAFLQACRVWRDRYEESAQYKTCWNIKFHLDLWESWGEVGGHGHRIAFMPLAHPPCAMLKDCDEGLHQEGFYEEKEGWMVMRMLTQG